MWGWIIDRLFGWLVGDARVEPEDERREYKLYHETEDVVSVDDWVFAPELVDKEAADLGDPVDAAIVAVKIRKEDYRLPDAPRFPQVLLEARQTDGRWYEVASIDARAMRGEWYVFRRPLLLVPGSAIDCHFTTKAGEPSPQTPTLQLKVVRRIYSGRSPTAGGS